MKFFKTLLFSILPFLTMTSCDFNADELEYEDVMGLYRGEGEAFVTVSIKQGITLDNGQHLNYGDTLVQALKSPEPIEMGILVNTENRLMFATSIPRISVLGRPLVIHYLGIDELPVENKGNHIISWGISELETPTITLPVETVYIPVNNIDIIYSSETEEEKYLTAKGYVAISIVNYSIQMELMIEEAPGFLTEGCALWMKYQGIMYSKETYNKKF